MRLSATGLSAPLGVTTHSPTQKSKARWSAEMQGGGATGGGAGVAWAAIARSKVSMDHPSPAQSCGCDEFDTSSARWLPASCHDVVNLAHPPAIDLGDAIVGAAAVAEGEEAVAGLGEQANLVGVGPANGGSILLGHGAIEPGK